MIFYKGCPLRCQWCCNPESQSFEVTVMYDHRLCRKFGDCLKSGLMGLTPGQDGIQIERSTLQHAEKLRDICATRALTVSGEEKSVEALLSAIEKDAPFYIRSEGGVTLSGGEPLSQGPELVYLLEELKARDIDVTMETSLYVPWDKIERCVNLTSVFLVDLKHTEDEKFYRFTGGRIARILENLRKLASCHPNIIVRVPVIPGFNHTFNEIKGIVDVVAGLRKVKEIHFLPYHNLGAGKYALLGMEYEFAEIRSVESKELDDYMVYAKSLGFNVKIGG